MAPAFDNYQLASRTIVEKPKDGAGLVLEAWAQGYMVGSLIIMSAITISNMRKGVLLHKLILLELLTGTFHGTFIFMDPPVYGWYLSCTAIFLNFSWSLHNVVAWMKTAPFLSRKWSLFYIGTVILAQPYWILEIYANFAYFNNINDLFLHTRPYEALFRDPWWIFTIINLFYNIKTRYECTVFQIIRSSPRFGVLLTAMLLSMAFIIIDICAVTGAIPSSSLPDGLNPFWKLAYVFKCLTDSVILDDFKTALDKLMRFRMRKLGNNVAAEDPFGDDAIDEQKMAETSGSFAKVEMKEHANPNSEAGVGTKDVERAKKLDTDAELQNWDKELEHWAFEGSNSKS